MKRLFNLWILLGLAVLHVQADDADSLLMQCQVNFERFSQQFPQERVYLHFDNTSYYKNEDIWYKAYVVRGDNLHHTDLSRILYVELLNPIGYPVETQKLVIENGQAHGSFHLKDTLNAGFYEVRAYTAWMLNFCTGDPHGWDRLRGRDSKRHYGERLQRYLEGNAGVFSRVFPIYEQVDSGQYSRRRIPHPSKATASMVDPVKDRLKIDFYPEGGNIVRDIPTRIAFQAHNADGRTLNVAGALIRRGDSIGYFKTDYAGRGAFSVTADSLDTEVLTDGLQLKVTYHGHDYRFNLPQPKKKGYSLSVFNRGSQLKTMVARNASTEGMEVGLSVTSRGKTLYFDVLDLQSQLQTEVIIDSRSLQTGVNVVTLFTTKGQVLAQRLVFVNNHDMNGYRLKTTLPADTLNPYEQVDLLCQLVDTAGRPVQAKHDFSIAVTDNDTREETYSDATVLSYLLLASEVKGFIPHPEYFFEKDDPEHRGALDVLLMVQGWTRYDYEQMMSGSDFEPMLAIERGLTFAGRLWDDKSYESRRFWKLQNKKPTWIYSELYIDGDTVTTNPSIQLTISPGGIFHENEVKPQLILTGEAKVDSTGCFRLNMIPFYGKGRMAMVINKESIEALGLEDGGIAAHNFRWNTIRRPRYLLGKRIEPLNQYSPLPKNYDYYETAALADPIDRDMFRYGFMAVPKESSSNRMIYYDAVSRTYVLPEVQKKTRRRWSDFRDVDPVCVMDVRDMMAWLSNIFGDISDFKYRENDPYAGAPQNTSYNDINMMMLEDAREMDREFNTSQYSSIALRSIASEANYNERALDTKPHYARLAELLYVFGLDGMNCTYVNVDSVGNYKTYTTATGSKEMLPVNMHFFPVNENFETMQLYADPDNRRLTHQAGRYHETVFSYSLELATNNDHPLTSIFNFTPGNTYSNDHPLPDFLGFRINFQGLTEPAEFFHPDYDWEPEPEETDYRRTVYWNPQMSTDADGSAHITFFNNGFSRRLAVSAEGITASGQPITTQR